MVYSAGVPFPPTATDTVRAPTSVPPSQPDRNIFARNRSRNPDRVGGHITGSFIKIPRGISVINGNTSGHMRSQNHPIIGIVPIDQEIQECCKEGCLRRTEQSVLSAPLMLLGTRAAHSTGARRIICLYC